MARSIPVNLQFLANHNKPTAVQSKLIESASNVVHLCQVRLSQVNDEKTKELLSHLIEVTGIILNELSNSKDSADLRNHVLEVQLASLQLPKTLLEKPKMSSLSYSIAMACVFVLAFSVALSLGYVFHAVVYNYFSGKVFFDTLMSGLATIGVPASALGLFAYGLSILTDNPKEGLSEEKGMFDGLQNEVNTFCTLVKREEGSDISKLKPLHEVDSPKRDDNKGELNISARI